MLLCKPKGNLSRGLNSLRFVLESLANGGCGCCEWVACAYGHDVGTEIKWPSDGVQSIMKSCLLMSIWVCNTAEITSRIHKTVLKTQRWGLFVLSALWCPHLDRHTGRALYIINYTAVSDHCPVVRKFGICVIHIPLRNENEHLFFA